MNPIAFVSHAHEDRDVAKHIAEKLRSRGVDAWFDQWEIKPGDSLVQKIFEEGLKNCKVFMILLSPASVSSPWVRHELDSAIVQRISGSTRVVPVIVAPCEIPVSLRALLRIDLSTEGVDATVSKLVDVAFDLDRRPSLGPPPSGLSVSVAGLTNASAQLAVLLAGLMDNSDGNPVALSGEEISKLLKLSPEQLNDAVEELETLGLVHTVNWLGTHPYNFGQVQPTPSLPFYLRDSGVLSYDPENDVKIVAAQVAQEKHTNGAQLGAATGLPPSRINRAIAYLEAYSVVTVLRYLGSAPFDFGEVHATGATRRFVADNS